jgi:hypothetical protein
MSMLMMRFAHFLSATELTQVLCFVINFNIPQAREKREINNPPRMQSTFNNNNINSTQKRNLFNNENSCNRNLSGICENITLLLVMSSSSFFVVVVVSFSFAGKHHTLHSRITTLNTINNDIATKFRYTQPVRDGEGKIFFNNITFVQIFMMKCCYCHLLPALPTKASSYLTASPDESEGMSEGICFTVSLSFTLSSRATASESRRKNLKNPYELH